MKIIFSVFLLHSITIGDQVLGCSPTLEYPDTLPAGSLSTPEPPAAVYSQCGHSQYYHSVDDPGNGIVGGQDVKRNEFPWVVSIRTLNYPLCGGAILNTEWVITAAYCVSSYIADELLIIAGDHGRVYYFHGEKYKLVTEIVIHPNHTDSGYDFEIALLRISPSFRFNKWQIQPICLPEDCNDGCQEGQFAYISGWGLLDEDDRVLPIYLQVGLVEISSLSACKDAYENTEYLVSDEHICAVDSCYGDGGAPLMVNEDGYYKLCGVANYGQGCALPGYPGIYARICSIRQWIDSVIV